MLFVEGQRQMMSLVTTILTLILTTIVAVGQQRTISGRLINIEDKTPIPGWKVIEPGSKNGTVTDVNGEFTLTLNSRSAIIWFPQCFTQLYVEYEENVDFKEISLGTDIKQQIYRDSKKLEQKIASARATRTIRGEVVGKKSRQPIDSCEVRIQGTDNVVYTDSKGNFVITVPNSKTIELEIGKGEALRTVRYDADQDFRQIRLKPGRRFEQP